MIYKDSPIRIHSKNLISFLPILVVSLISKEILFGLKGIILVILFVSAVFCIVRKTKAVHNCEESADILRKQISVKRKIICEGPAAYIGTFSKTEGWLFFTENGLEFYPCIRNMENQSVAILKDEIKSVNSEFRILTVSTQDIRYSFELCRTSLWKKDILLSLKNPYD